MGNPTVHGCQAQTQFLFSECSGPIKYQYKILLMDFKWIPEQNMDDYWHQLTCAQAIEVMHVRLYTHWPDEPVIYLEPHVRVMWQISNVLVSEPHKSRLCSYLGIRLELHV